MRPASRIRARQWSRASWALAALFASLPVSSRIFLGVWGFDTAAEIAALCLFLGAYLNILSRRSHSIPDSAHLLDQAIEIARAGDVDGAAALLSEAIRLSPRLWQAYQYRGELSLAGNDPQHALDDFTQAIRIEPREPHLYRLRAHTHHLLGDDSASRQDAETAAVLASTPMPPA
jgi:predicted Zn-dependent protease